MTMTANDDLGALRVTLDVSSAAGLQRPLSGLTFAVKEMFDVAGYVTGGGNPDWLATHAPATRTAPAVQACLDAGARLTGIAIADELAFSMQGENVHYGTPVNPAAPDRIPGGSSSGSASATAGKLVDFALGTDTAGSIRIPASYCGLFGLRPTYGRISSEGVMPLSRSFDVVGWLARDANTLDRVGRVLLSTDTREARPIRRLLLLKDVLELADTDARPALEAAVGHLSDAIAPMEEITLSKHGYADWLAAFNTLRPPEIWSAYGEWIEDVQPNLGPQIAQRFEAAKKGAGADTRDALAFRREVQKTTAELLGPDAALVFPTAPTIAPKKGMSDSAAPMIREHTLRVSCLSPLLGFPEISMPLVSVEGCPMGLSLMAPQNADELLLRAAVKLGDVQPTTTQG